MLPNPCLRWALIRFLAHRVVSSHQIISTTSPPPDLGEYDHHLLFNTMMRGKDRCWGRFAVYVVWLCHHYEPDQAYQRFLDIKRHYPHRLPFFLCFVGQCLVSWGMQCLHG